MIALGFFLAAYAVPGIVVSNLYVALILAFFWGVMSFVARPILIILTLPLSILTLGLFTFVINAALFWFLGTCIKGFEVEGFIPAFLGAFVVTLTYWIGHKFIK